MSGRRDFRCQEGGVEIDLSMASSLPAKSALNLSEAPEDVIAVLLGTMDLKQRFKCALVCSGWAKIAAATTHSIVRHGVWDLTALLQWLEKNGSHVKSMQLHICHSLDIAGLPCTQLQDLLLHGDPWHRGSMPRLGSRVWSDIAAATKLTSVSFQRVRTESQQADVVSALTALPDLQQLTWHWVRCLDMRDLSDSRLLQQLTKLTGLELSSVTAEALQHLGSLSKLQHLNISGAREWDAANFPGWQAACRLQLQQLTALTSLRVDSPLQGYVATVSHLTALQQLKVSGATLAALKGLTALTKLTKLCVEHLIRDGPDLTPLQLPVLQTLEMNMEAGSSIGSIWLHMLQLSSCTQLRRLSLKCLTLVGPSSLVASSMLQELDLHTCTLRSPEGPAYVAPWELVFPGPGWLPHLTSLKLRWVSPSPRQADIERLVACCNGLRVLRLTAGRPDWGLTNNSAYDCLSHLTSSATLHLSSVTDQQCSSLAQLTGLQELQVTNPAELSPVGLRQLARLHQLTSLGFLGSWDSCRVSSVLQVQLSDPFKDCDYALVNKVRPGCS